MKTLKYFFECYFNQSFGFEDLDKRILDFKREVCSIREQLISDLDEIIQTNKYAFASRIISKYGDRTFDEKETEKFIKYLYYQFLDKPTTVKAADFKKKYKIIFCPICTPYPKIATIPILIDKATVIDKNIQIYICKHCKLIWLDENDIRSDNAFDYKKFMKANGLKGQWKELKDIDVL